MRSVVALCIGGIIIEAGCAWILVWSPSLTAIYTPAFTAEFWSRVPWRPMPFIWTALDAPGMLGALEVGLCAMIAGYLLTLRGLSTFRGRNAGPIILGFALLFRTTLLLLPGLFSTDIFSYVMSGRIAAVYGRNPYVEVPADFPGDPFLSWVFPFWRDSPTVYGPVWTNLSWLLGRLTGEWTNFDQVLAYRLTLFALELLSLVLLWRLLSLTIAGKSAHPQRRVAFCVLAWNPLVLFDLVGNAHNDIVMVVLVQAGILLAIKQRPSASAVALAASALVKFTTAVAGLMWVAAWSGAARTTSRRATRLTAALGLMLGVTLLSAWPWMEPAALASLQASSGGRVVINSAPEVVAVTVARVVLAPIGVGQESGEAGARMWTRLLVRGMFAIYVAWEAARLWRSPHAGTGDATHASIRAATRVLLVLPLVALSSVWSWYFSWSLALAVLLGWRAWLTRLVVLYTLVNLPTVYAQQYLNEAAPGVLPLVSAAGPLIVWACWYRVTSESRCGAERHAVGSLGI